MPISARWYDGTPREPKPARAVGCKRAGRGKCALRAEVRPETRKYIVVMEQKGSPVKAGVESRLRSQKERENRQGWSGLVERGAAAEEAGRTILKVERGLDAKIEIIYSTATPRFRRESCKAARSRSTGSAASNIRSRRCCGAKAAGLCLDKHATR